MRLRARSLSTDAGFWAAFAVWSRNDWPSPGSCFLRVGLPLENRDGVAIGVFEGVYRLDTSTLRQASADLGRNVALVLLAVLVTAAALYPVVVGLNRGVLTLSMSLMRSNVELMEVLGAAIAKRDSDTDLHNYRVCLYSIRFAEALGLAETDIDVFDAMTSRRRLSGGSTPYGKMLVGSAGCECR